MYITIEKIAVIVGIVLACFKIVDVTLGIREKIKKWVEEHKEEARRPQKEQLPQDNPNAVQINDETIVRVVTADPAEAASRYHEHLTQTE